MDSLLIFGNVNKIYPKILIKEIYSFVKDSKDLTICGVVDTGKRNPSPKLIKTVKVFLSELEKKIFNFDQKLDSKSAIFNNFYDIYPRLHINVIVPPQRNINDQEFINFLKESVKPTMGLSVGCLQIFKKDLINIFDVLVNYHNGLLPDFAGRKTTSWSVYFNKKYTGFTYHLINNENIDGGNILFQEKIPIFYRDNNVDLEYLKTIKASKYIGNVLNKMIARDTGIAQGKQIYFGKKDYEAIIKIKDPGELTFSEIERRLFAFKKLKIKIHDKYYPVTKIRKCNLNSKNKTKMIFKTKDHIFFKPVRFLYLPIFLYKIRSIIKKCYKKAFG